ncbi:CotH kinase family protein [Paraglaciecola sp.]|uniref:CotH kinase family protein n=1 Tax=Paraglaciecola sp. TaxID=1920173 RepID=UPI003EF1373E
MNKLKKSKISLALLTALLVCGCGSSGTTESDNTNIENNAPVDPSINYAGKLKITEVLTKDENDGNDWIEIQVIGEQAVDLTGFTVADSTSEPAALPEIVVQPGEYLVVQATDNAPADGSYYVPFKLGDDDSVTLTYGEQVIDSLIWQDSDVKKGRSYGEYAGELQRLYPTPNQDNIPFNAFLTEEVVKVEINLSDEDWQNILDNPLAEEYKPASLIYNGIELAEVAVRTKGNSSLNAVARDPDSNRYGFKVDINYYQDDQKLLGLKKLSFNNNYSDPSMMREYLSYQMMDDMQVPTPRIAYVDLYIGGEHMGLYNVVEAIDSEFIERHFDNDEGDLYKADIGSDLTFVDYTAQSYNSLELKANEETSDKQALINFVDALSNSNEPANNLNVDLWLRYLAVNTFLVNLDSYQGIFAHNFYLYQDINEQGDQITMLPWDYNMSMGGFSGGCNLENMSDFLIDEPVTTSIEARPLVDKILAIDEYKQTFHKYLNELVTTTAEYGAMSTKIDNIATLIAPFVAADPTKFFDEETWRTSLDVSVDSTSNLAGGGGMIPGGGGMIPGGGGMIPGGGGMIPGGGGMIPGGGGMIPGGGMGQSGTIAGIREFLSARINSVSEQLSGTIPSTSTGGNGGCSS